MERSHRLPLCSYSLPPQFLSCLAVFADLFTRPTWPNVLILLAGVILTPGRRTIAAALRILGRDRNPDFCTFHRILNRAAWSSRAAMLFVHVPWADRIMALPFLTLLAPSKRFYSGKLRAPKTLVDWARQAALQIRRWLPDRYIVVVADSAFAAIEFLAAVRKHVCVVTRLRLDANLFAFPPAKRKGRGRPAIKGKRLRKLSAVLKDPKIPWQRCRISLWYGRTDRLVEITSGTALWYRAGIPPVPIRWVLVRDPKGELDPQAFLATDLEARPQDILAWFVCRWQVEVTFEEVRARLGVETQRQWSDMAILRTTPALLGLFSIITLFAHDLAKTRKLKIRTAAWYPKALPTFSDAIAAVRREIWAHQISFMSRPRRDRIEIPQHIWQRMQNALAYAA